MTSSQGALADWSESKKRAKGRCRVGEVSYSKGTNCKGAGAVDAACRRVNVVKGAPPPKPLNLPEIRSKVAANWKDKSE